MKKCNVCKIELTEDNSFKHRNECKKCKSKREKEQRKTPRYMIKTIYLNQIRNSKSDKRRSTEVAYSESELFEFCLRNGLLSMIEDWKESGEDKNKKPSIDRIDNSLGYTIDNIQLVTWEHNNSKGVNERKKEIVVLNGDIEKVFESRREASIFTNVSEATITRLTENGKSSKGYRFKYL